MINWPDIDTVLLDMDGTLLDLHFDNHFWNVFLPKHFADVNGHHEDEARDQLTELFGSHRGTLNWYCVDFWSNELGLDIENLKHEVSHLIAIRPYVTEFLKQLQQAHQQVILVTNAHQKSLDIKMDKTGIAELFDHIVVSHDFRLPKEDVDFWQRLDKAHPFDPQRTLLIDDNMSVLESAQDYGIKHLLTLLQPDSQQEKRVHTAFPGIHHFDEIMPITKEHLIT